MKFEAEGREFAKILRSLEQFIKTVKGKKNFLVTECFLNLLSNLNSNCSNLLDLRKLQELNNPTDNSTYVLNLQRGWRAFSANIFPDEYRASLESKHMLEIKVLSFIILCN